MTLLRLRIADDPTLWESLGFAVSDGTCTIDGVELELAGSSAGSGIVGWTLEGDWPAEMDGIATLSGAAASATPSTASRPASHPNHVTSIDHLVVSTPDLDRTIEALLAAGLELRRIREIGKGIRQAFFWIGAVIIEVVGPQGEPGPSRLWGLAFNTIDLDATAAFLGDRCTQPKDAVQRGRRIASVTRDAGSSVPITFMTPH